MRRVTRSCSLTRLGVCALLTIGSPDLMPAGVCPQVSLAVPQPVQSVIYVTDFHVKAGKEEEFVDLIKKHEQPLFDKLMAEGVVLGWGVVTPMLHKPGASTHSLWWSCPNMGDMDRVFDELNGARALKGTRTLEQRFLETTDISKHRDFLFHNLRERSGKRATAGAKPDIWLGFTRVLPGRTAEYIALWERYNRPMLDKLLADGAILSYGLSIEEVKTTNGFTHMSWMTLPDLAARDNFRNAAAADRQARPEQERKQITQGFVDVTDPTASRGAIMRSLIFAVVAPPRK